MTDETTPTPRGADTGADPETGTGSGTAPAGPPPPPTPPSSGQAPPQVPPTPPYGPPPQSGPWAAQFGLIRPRHGRYLAGVCASIGRATNTDPVLWRVLIGVLSLFGLGIAIYLLFWLLTPAEGDSASPVEALIGRGRSSTSTTVTVLLGILAVLLVGGMTDNFPAVVVVVIGLILVAVLLGNRSGWRAGAPVPVVPVVPPMQPGAAYPPQAPAGMPGAAYSSAPGAQVTAPIPPDPSGYRPPFAPHGPYAPPAPALPPFPPAPQVLPLRPKPEPSRLGRLVFGLVLIALGGLGLADLSGASVGGTVYLAAALAVVGLGLVLGAWVGRARGLIALGIVLSLVLPMTTAVADWDRERAQGGTKVWVPASTAELKDRYEFEVGQATLDLRQVDFTGKAVEVSTDVSFGEFVVLLPPNVDVTVDVDVNLGNANVLGRSISGPGVDDTVVDKGADGEGGGSLRLKSSVNLGNMEVTR